MTVLYKYLKKEHVEGALTIGRFMIGTLYDFRNIEKHGMELDDANEAKEFKRLFATSTTEFKLDGKTLESTFFMNHTVDQQTKAFLKIRP